MDYDKVKDFWNKINHSNLIAPVNFYAYAAALTHYLLTEFDIKYFRKMCKLVREEDYQVEQAVLESYRFKNAEELDKQWFEYLAGIGN